MIKARLIQNENYKNETLGIEGTNYVLDGDGVLRCSENVANFLLATPGWVEFKRNYAKSLDAANTEVLQAEAGVKAAEDRLEKALENYKEMEKSAEENKKADAQPIREVMPEKPAVAPEPVEDESKEEVSAEDIPTMLNTKAEMIAFCDEYGLDYDPKGNKSDLLRVIEDSVEE